MHELSAAQQKYLHIQKRHRRVVCVSRILILFGFYSYGNSLLTPGSLIPLSSVVPHRLFSAFAN